MTFGYLLIISEHASRDYLKMAYALALSIKNTQKEGFDKVALVTDNVKKVKKLKSPWVFDEVIHWDKETYWDGRSWMDKLSPWDHTICLDVDMLFLRDYSHWAEYFIKNNDLYIANKSYTISNKVVSKDFYRQAFTKNKLPNLYSFYTFFKKDSELVDEFFTLGRYIIKNHLEFSVPNMSAGDILIRNAAIRKYLKKMDGNCIRKFEPFDPQTADSPLIYFWDVPSNLNYVSKCLPCFSVDPHTIDKDPIMDKLLQNPRIGLDILINIHNTMYKEGTLHTLRGTKLGGFLQLYKANVMRK
jgi:hypothetical protein